MVSNNSLLGSGVKKENTKKRIVEIDEKLGWAKRLYHVDFLKGKVFQTLPEQDEMKKIGWVESPVDVGKTSLFGGFEDKKSKIDVSVKNVKTKVKTKTKGKK